ncbi:MAG: hypothetical protein GDA50_04370, partial [Alphaproteobacteria bacterium GM202ARS2]|nr:hypothetical protein [Alphaproteobacteria bacterium GM202ARS2]
PPPRTLSRPPEPPPRTLSLKHDSDYSRLDAIKKPTQPQPYTSSDYQNLAQKNKNYEPLNPDTRTKPESDFTSPQRSPSPPSPPSEDSSA